MKNTRKIDFLLLTYGLLISLTILALCYVLFAGYVRDRVLIKKSVTIICKLKEYQRIHQKLPSTLTQLMNENGWWDELGYEKIDDRDFRLNISDGFDSTAIYDSTENRWDRPHSPFLFQQKSMEINCQPQL
jgi:hypothetical protein